MCMCHVVGYGTSGFSMFCLMISQISDFRKKIIDIKCIFWISRRHSSEWIRIVRRIQREIVTHLRSCSCTVFLILTRFLFHLNIFRHVIKNQTPGLLKTYWKPSCCIRTNGQVDMKKSKAAFPSFSNTSKIRTRSGKLRSYTTLNPASMILWAQHVSSDFHIFQLQVVNGVSSALLIESVMNLFVL